MTLSDQLREQATEVVSAIDPNEPQRRAQAVRDLRNATAGQYGPLPLPIQELIEAVDWALAQEQGD